MFDQEQSRRKKPDSSEFSTPEDELIYDLTEELLVSAPPLGTLSLHDCFTQWERVYTNALKTGVAEEVAIRRAWGVVASFIPERLLLLEASLQISGFQGPRPSELGALQTWSEISVRHINKHTERFEGKPSLVAPGNGEKQDWRSFPPEQRLPVNISLSSPIYGHVQFIDAMAHLQRIPDNVTASVLHYATDYRQDVAFSIETWNEHMVNLSPQEEKAYPILLESTAKILLLTLISSWGEDPDLNIEALTRAYEELSGETLPIYIFRTISQLEQSFDETFKDKDPYSEAVMLPYLAQVLAGSERTRVKEGGASGYMVELDGFKGLYFGITVTFDVSTHSYVGTMVVAHEGNKPLRKIMPAMPLEASSPQEAITALIEYLQQTPDARVLPDGIKLNNNQYAKALRRLQEQKITKLR